MAGAIRGRGEGNKSSLRHRIVLGPLMLCWSGYGLVNVGSSGLIGATKLGSGSGRPAELPQSVPWNLSKALGSRVVVRLIGPCSASMVARSCSHKVVAAFVMRRLRHKMQCRRGTPRRASSSPSSNSPSSDFISGHYPCTRSGRGRFLLPRHYPEPRPPNSSSSPSFGSAIFTFNCTLNHPRITAHISVLFLEQAQEVGESISHQEGPGLVSVPNPCSSQAPEVPASNAIDMVMEPTAPGPSVNDAARAQDPSDVGWCRIVEEPPDA